MSNGEQSPVPIYLPEMGEYIPSSEQTAQGVSSTPTPDYSQLEIPSGIPVQRKRNPCPRSPWDENSYFASPRVTWFANLLGAAEILPANPMRVGFIISADVPAGQTAYVHPVGSGVPVPPTPFAGMVLNNTNPTVRVTQGELGPLAAVSWMFRAFNVTNVVVIELVMDKWPG